MPVCHYRLSVFNLLEIVQIDESSPVYKNKPSVTDDFKEFFDSSVILDGFSGLYCDFAVPGDMADVKNIPVRNALYIAIVRNS